MTEPNKELPKEVENANEWRQIEPHPHYAPIIEAKDKEIAELNNGLKNSMEVLTENGERIAELEAEVWLRDDKCRLYDEKVDEQDATISKLMGLLKEWVWEDEYDRHYSIFNDEQDAQKSADKEWTAFCKSHGIDLRGE